MNMLTGGFEPPYNYASPFSAMPMHTGGNGYAYPTGQPAMPMQTGGMEPPQQGMITGGNLPPMQQMIPHYNRLANLMYGNHPYAPAQHLWRL